MNEIILKVLLDKLEKNTNISIQTTNSNRVIGCGKVNTFPGRNDLNQYYEHEVVSMEAIGYKELMITVKDKE